MKNTFNSEKKRKKEENNNRALYRFLLFFLILGIAILFSIISKFSFDNNELINSNNQENVKKNSDLFKIIKSGHQLKHEL